MLVALLADGLLVLPPLLSKHSGLEMGLSVGLRDADVCLPLLPGQEFH